MFFFISSIHTCDIPGYLKVAVEQSKGKTHRCIVRWILFSKLILCVIIYRYDSYLY